MDTLAITIAQQILLQCFLDHFIELASLLRCENSTRCARSSRIGKLLPLEIVRYSAGVVGITADMDIMNADGTHPIPLTTDAAEDDAPTWIRLPTQTP